MWEVYQELEEDLAAKAEEFQKRRSIIPKLRHMPSGEALVELLNVLSDMYFHKLTNTDPSNVAQMGYYQGAYKVLAKILEEIHNQDQAEQEEA